MKTSDQRQLYLEQIPRPDPRSIQHWPRNAMPEPPGSGPEGETCGSCSWCYGRRIRSGRVFYKCGHMRETRGGGTDIKLKYPACGRWEARK